VKALRGVALASAISHGGALALAGVVIAPEVGLPDAASRAAHVATHTARWLSGWIGWLVAGAFYLLFIVALRRELRGRCGGLGLAVGLGAVGLVVELTGHFVNAVSITRAAQQGDVAAVVELEPLAVLLGAMAPQPLYAGSTLLFVRAVAKVGASRLAIGAGAVNAIAGLAMMAVAELSPAKALPVATVLLVASLLTFQLSLAFGSTGVPAS
jgi:hypothetical protein